MKIQKTPHNKRNIIIATAIIAILVIGTPVAAYFVLNQQNQSNQAAEDKAAEKTDNTVDYEAATDEQVEAGNQAKEEFIEGNENTATTDAKIEISSENQTGSNYQVRTIISSASADGTCTLKLSKSGQSTVTQEAGVQVYPSYGTCKGFDVDVSALVTGTWKLEVTYAKGGASTSATKDITLL